MHERRTPTFPTEKLRLLQRSSNSKLNPPLKLQFFIRPSQNRLPKIGSLIGIRMGHKPYFNRINSEMFIFATIKLHDNTTTWGTKFCKKENPGDVPAMHDLSRSNLRSFKTIDFLSEKVEADKRDYRAAGITNSWGFLMPLGAIIARHAKVFGVANPVWFHLHVTCQFLGYLDRAVSCGTVLWLG